MYWRSVKQPKVPVIQEDYNKILFFNVSVLHQPYPESRHFPCCLWDMHMHRYRQSGKIVLSPH